MARADSMYPLPFTLDHTENFREAVQCELENFYRSREGEKRSLETYKVGAQFGYIFLQMMRRIFECGCTGDFAKNLTSAKDVVSKVKDDDFDVKKRARILDMSRWIRRVIRGTFAAEYYAYFRPAEGIEINPVGVLAYFIKGNNYPYKVLLKSLGIRPH